MEKGKSSNDRLYGFAKERMNDEEEREIEILVSSSVTPKA